MFQAMKNLLQIITKELTKPTYERKHERVKTFQVNTIIDNIFFNDNEGN